MKTYNITIFICLASLLMLFGCKEDNPYGEILTDPSGSTLEYLGEYRISSFEVDTEELIIEDGSTRNFTFTFTTPEGKAFSFTGSMMLVGDRVLCRVSIPAKKNIPDGEYLLTLKNEAGRELSSILKLQIRKEMVTLVLGSNYKYSLSGSGSSIDPYIIKTEEDYKNFFLDLRKDPNYASNYYFEQRGDIVAPAYYLSISCDCMFRGNYNGNNHTITRNYGNTSATEGLFYELQNNAVIKNLKIKTYITNENNSTVGALANRATGKVVVDKVSVSGIMKGQGYISGLISQVEKANISLTNINISGMEISSTAGSVGGLIASAKGSDILIDNVVIEDNSIFGRIFVGGLIGELADGSIRVSNVVVKVNDKIKNYIKADNSHAGGLIGIMDILKSCSFENVEVRTVVTAKENAGGLIADLYVRNTDITFKNCMVYNYGVAVESNFVGGFIGRARGYSNDCRIVFDGEKNEQYSNIKGTSFVGGVFGEIDKCQLSIKSAMRINMNAEGNLNVGGFAGSLKNTGDAPIMIDKCQFNKMMVVNGMNSVGGFAGYCENANLKGSLKLVLSDKTVIDKAATVLGNSIFPGTVYASDRYCGGLVGLSHGGIISNFYIRATAECPNSVGGLIGYASNTVISDCYSDCVSIKGNNYIGGIAGQMINSRIGFITCSNLVNNSPISSPGQSVGGVVGILTSVTSKIALEMCVNLAPITGRGDVGGIAATNNPTENYFKDCANYGEITGTNGSGESGVGGILGNALNAVSIDQCVNYGKIVAYNTSGGVYQGTGGIAGVLGEKAFDFNQKNYITVKECCNFGTIDVSDGEGKNNAGGVVGYIKEGPKSKNYSPINCYNAGEVIVDRVKTVGGILGLMSDNNYCSACINIGKVDGSYGSGDVGNTVPPTFLFCGITNVYVLHHSAAIWKGTFFYDSDKGNPSKFNGLDFNKTWKLSEPRNNGYPCLLNCYFQFAVKPQIP